MIIYTVYVLTNSIERNSLATEAFASLSPSIPRLLDAPCLESKQAKMVSCGARHSAILTEDGQVFSWGWNKHGQLGVGDSMDRNIPS